MERSENPFEEVRSTGHEQIPKSAKVLTVAHFLSENVRGIAFGRDMLNGNRTIGNPFGSCIFPVFNVTVSFSGKIVVPPHTSVVVVVEWCSDISVVDRVTNGLEVQNQIAKVDCETRAHVCSPNFSLAHAQ